MKHPSILFAFIALAAGIVASRFVSVRAVDGQMLAGSFSHEFEEQGEGVLPSLAHANSGVSVVMVDTMVGVKASLFDAHPCLVGWRPLPFRGVAMFRWPVGVVARGALSRRALLQVSSIDDVFSSAVTTAEPLSLAIEFQDSPLSETLAGQVYDSFFVGAFAAHGRFALGEVWAEQFLFDAAVTPAEPVLTNDMGEDGVPSETLPSEIFELFRARHLMSSLERGCLTGRTKIHSNMLCCKYEAPWEGWHVLTVLQACRLPRCFGNSIPGPVA